jgi:hypothetical protein
MPSQKMFQANPQNPSEIEALFGLAIDLAMEGWGTTTKVNAQVAVLTTDAPMKVILAFSAKAAV